MKNGMKLLWNIACLAKASSARPAYTTSKTALFIHSFPKQATPIISTNINFLEIYHAKHSFLPKSVSRNASSSPTLDEKKDAGKGHLSKYSQWNSLDFSVNSSKEKNNAIAKENRIRNLLVCGDGDLSFSASIAPELAQLGISLTATVLEAEDVHRRVYNNSIPNTDIISSYDNHRVIFGVDATNLDSYFSKYRDTFDRIQFNFPHWRGKNNNKYNRELLSNFLRSSYKMLSDDDNAEIHVALCDGQGGSNAASLDQWKASWMAAHYASQHNLLLVDASPFQARYNRSSHRGVDRAFAIGKIPKLYKFIKPTSNKNRIVPEHLQLCFRQELHIIQPSPFSADDGQKLQYMIQNLVPEGIRVEVPLCDSISLNKSKQNILVFTIVYCGEYQPLTRDLANDCRSYVEHHLSKIASLRSDKVGRMVSKPFPYSILHTLIDDGKDTLRTWKLMNTDELI